MKVAVFSAKNYDREFLEAANASRHELQFFEPHLNEETVGLAAGFHAVWVFVNDRVDGAVVAKLASSGWLFSYTGKFDARVVCHSARSAFCFAEIDQSKNGDFLVEPRLDQQLPREGERRYLSAVWCGMRMPPPPANSLMQFALRDCNRAEPVEIWKARKFIHELSDEELSLTKVAKFVHISANHLSEKFKQVTGVNFVDYVAHIRIEKACDLLQDRHVRISEIAFAVGFQSLSQFNRVFKKISGRSPSAYRAARRSRFLG
jgi:AraC-like DNA-binding protein